MNNARIILPNLLTANGVVHIIDSLLNPGNSTGFSDNPNSNVPFTSGVSVPTGTILTLPTFSGVTGGNNSHTGGNGSHTSKTNVGAIAGGVVGGVAAIVLIVFLIWFFRKRRGSSPRPGAQPAMASVLDRENTVKSFRKAELDGRNPSAAVYTKPELEAGVMPNKTAEIYEASATNSSSGHAELAGSAAALSIKNQASTRGNTHQSQLSAELADKASITPVRSGESARLGQTERMSYQKRIAEIENERKLAELEYEHQTRLVRLEHERRMAEMHEGEQMQARNHGAPAELGEDYRRS